MTTEITTAKGHQLGVADPSASVTSVTTRLSVSQQAERQTGGDLAHGRRVDKTTPALARRTKQRLAPKTRVCYYRRHLEGPCLPYQQAYTAQRLAENPHNQESRVERNVGRVPTILYVTVCQREIR